MNGVVFSFVRPSVNTVIASVRIAQFVAKTLDFPLICNEHIRDDIWDVLILVNGAFSFCPVRDQVAKAVRTASRIIWVQNDYAIYPPIADGTAESTFRKAFRLRKQKGLPHMDIWTTVHEKSTMTKSSRYINWNALTALKTPLDVQRDVPKDLFYYGSYRIDRRPAFDRFFTSTKIPITLSSASKKFIERFPHITYTPAIQRGQFYRELNRHGLGLYIEDPRSHRQFHSPANRFYEMLSAGLPMVFEPESVSRLLEAGYDVTAYVVENTRDIRHFMRRRRRIAGEQREQWWERFRFNLRHDVRRAFRRYTRTHFPSTT